MFSVEDRSTDLVTLRRARKRNCREGPLAAIIQKETTMRLDWITEQLNRRTPAGVGRLASEVREHFAADHALGRKIEAMSNIGTH